MSTFAFSMIFKTFVERSSYFAFFVFRPTIERVTAHIIMITIALVLAVSIVANLYTWSRTLQALVFSQRRHLQRSISKLETLKSEGFIQTLRGEVSLMTDMVNRLFSFAVLYIGDLLSHCKLLSM